MLSYEQINTYTENYEQILSENNNLSKGELESFREEEKNLKIYNEKINELEKEQMSSNLEVFENYKNSILENLKENFIPDDMDYTVNYINYMIEQISLQKKDLNSVALEVKLINRNWSKFTNNKNINNTWIDNLIKKEFNKMDMSLDSFTIDDVGSVLTEASLLKEKINSLIESIEFIHDDYNKYIYIGDEALKIKEKIINLQNREFESINFFLDEVRIQRKEIENVINSSIVSRVKIPIIEVFKKNKKDVKNYTLSFNNKILKYNTFFNEGVTEMDTGQYMYFKNFPKKGIYSGKRIVEEFDYDDNYLKGVTKYNKYIDNIFIAIFILIISSSFISFNPMFFLPLSLSLLMSGWMLSHLIKSKIEKSFNIPLFFPHEEINKLIYKDGYDLDLEEIFKGIIFNIDDTMIELDNKELYI